jgi:hypothetical protein
MVRFSNSSLSNTQYTVTGITPVLASPTAVVVAIPTATPPAKFIPPASRYTGGLSSVGVSSNAYDVVTDSAESNVDLGLLYSNGHRYQYLDFKANTAECSTQVPSKVSTVQVQTESGPIYVEEVISGYTLVKAYVGNSVAVPQRPNANITIITNRPPSKVESELTNNNNC